MKELPQIDAARLFRIPIGGAIQRVSDRTGVEFEDRRVVAALEPALQAQPDFVEVQRARTLVELELAVPRRDRLSVAGLNRSDLHRAAVPGVVRCGSVGATPLRDGWKIAEDAPEPCSA